MKKYYTAYIEKHRKGYYRYSTVKIGRRKVLYAVWVKGYRYYIPVEIEYIPKKVYRRKPRIAAVPEIKVPEIPEEIFPKAPDWNVTERYLAKIDDILHKQYKVPIERPASKYATSMRTLFKRGYPVPYDTKGVYYPFVDQSTGLSWEQKTIDYKKNDFKKIFVYYYLYINKNISKQVKRDLILFTSKTILREKGFTITDAVEKHLPKIRERIVKDLKRSGGKIVSWSHFELSDRVKPKE